MRLKRKIRSNKASFAGHLVLIRHGQSEWNKKNLFTGWIDVNLSQKGEEEALRAGEELKKRKLHFDFAFSSALKRAIRTMEIILDQMDLNHTPVCKAWQLNERHYGALQGQNRQDVIDKYGAEQVHLWRRDFNLAPPPLKQAPRLKEFNAQKIPKGESLKDTQRRVLPFWENNIWPLLQNGKSVLVVAHGNSLRSLIKKLENISDQCISSLEIKTGEPLIYKLDQKANIFSKQILKI